MDREQIKAREPKYPDSRNGTVVVTVEKGAVQVVESNMSLDRAPRVLIVDLDRERDDQVGEWDVSQSADAIAYWRADLDAQRIRQARVMYSVRGPEVDGVARGMGIDPRSLDMEKVQAALSAGLNAFTGKLIKVAIAEAAEAAIATA